MKNFALTAATGIFALPLLTAQSKTANPNVPVTDASRRVEKIASSARLIPCPSLNPTTTAENCEALDGTASANATGGTPPYTFQWSDPGNQTTATATGLAAGIYYVTLTDSVGCSITDSATVNSVGGFSAFTSVTLEHCGQADGTASVNVTGTGFTFQWDAAAGGQTTQTATGLAAGTYSVTVTDTTGCSNVLPATVQNSEGPNFITQAANESCEGATDGTAIAFITGGASPFQFLWSNDQTNDSLAGLSAGTYTVTVTDANGCFETDSAIVGLDKADCETFNIPSAFTPNGDLKNDLWVIRGLDDAGVLVEVYNRWGSLVFSSKGYNEPWDGTCNGQPAPSAVYYYIITFSWGDTETGTLTVVR